MTSPSQSESRHFRSRGYLRILNVVAFLVLLCGCAPEPIALQEDLSLTDQSALGQMAFRQVIQKNGGTFRDENLIQYLNTIGKRLALNSARPDLPLIITLVDDSAPNVFTLPGGYIAITRGLLSSFSCEAEVAALLGHQIAHLLLDHGHSDVRSTQQNNYPGGGSFRTNKLSNSESISFSSAPGVATLIERVFTAGEEAEASHLGIDLLVGAGYDPAGSILLQELWGRQMTSENRSHWTGSYFHSHPYAAERLADTRRYIAQKYPGVAGGGRDEIEFARAIINLTLSLQGFATCDEARQLEREGRLAEAISLYHQALLEVADEPLILTSLGLAYLRNEDVVPARRYLIKAVNLKDDYYKSRLGLGYAYLQKQQFDKALSELEIGFRLFPTLEGGFMLAEAREHSGDKPGAIRLYQAVVKEDAAGKLGRNAADRLQVLGE